MSALPLRAQTDGICYVETANIDGETNLKIRSSPDSTAAPLQGGDGAPRRGDLGFASKAMAKVSGRIVFEEPNASINTFKGRFEAMDGLHSDKAFENTPLGAKNLLLRGCVVRNTKWVVGVVVFTGEDTKVAQNSRETPVKVSSVDSTMNTMIMATMMLQVLLSVLSVVGMLIWQARVFGDDVGAWWYLFPMGVKASSTLPDWLARAGEWRVPVRSSSAE